ncbi:MAG: universal stress protein [Nocardioides sp.]
MIGRILVAVADSAPSLAAARAAVGLASTLGAELRVLTVADRDRDPEPILRHVEGLARRAGVAVSTQAERDGVPPFESTLAAAREWHADLIVMGRTDERRTGRAYLGSQTEHLLEFTEVPVLVVPDGGSRLR